MAGGYGREVGAGGGPTVVAVRPAAKVRRRSGRAGLDPRWTVCAAAGARRTAGGTMVGAAGDGGGGGGGGEL